MNLKPLSLTLLCLLITATVFSQTGSSDYSIKGTVIDSATQEPIDFVTVGLKDEAKKAIKSALTKDGIFLLDKLKPGKYTVNVVVMGYSPIILPVNLTNESAKATDLGTIKLSSSSKELNAVTITADKPLIKQEVDRISYDLQADPESKINNVLDMMRKVPLLSVDADDNIQLNGSGNYKILINGKPSSMMERSPKDILKGMSASNIQSIEVITTPPAKYDSEGLAGIINIITNKKVDNGYNGGLNAYGRYPISGGLGGNLNMKLGKFGFSGYGGFGNFKSPRTISSMDRQTLGSTNPVTLSQNGSRYSNGDNGYFGSELSYEIDTLNLISAQFSTNGYGSHSILESKSRSNDLTKLLQSFDLYNDGDQDGKGLDLAVNYQKGFKSNKNRLLTFSYRFYRYGYDQLNSVTALLPFAYNIPDYKQNNDSKSSEQTIQIDYVHPIKKLNIEAGIKGILRDNKSDFSYRSFNSTTGAFDIDPARSNNYDNNQDIVAAYNTYQYTSKNWSIKGGLRIEQTIVHADFISTGSKVDQNYFNVIPSVSLNYKLKTIGNLTFGFTQRIQRPNIYSLNPFIDRSNPNFEAFGNPNLRPVLSNNLQLGYSKFKKGSINLGLTYSFANNTVEYVSFYNEATNITSSTSQNIGRNRSFGTNFNINYPIFKKLTVTLAGNMNYLRLNGIINGSPAQNEGLNGSFRASTNYTVGKTGVRLGVNGYYSTPYIMLQGKSTSYQYISFSLNKDLIKEKLSFSASTTNPFTKYRNFITTTTGANFQQSSFNQSYFRNFSLSLNYRFGKLKEAIKKNKRGISNDDVSSGAATTQ